MKKKIILIVLALALVIGAVAGGITYAQVDHNPPKGHKLIGTGMLGNSESPRGEMGGTAVEFEFGTGFEITNPNCDKSLTIEYVAIMDEDGNVVVEGTPLAMNLAETIGPHDIWMVPLIVPGGSPPMIGDEPSNYTVEITWSGHADRDLIGWSMTGARTYVCTNGYDPNVPFDDQVDDYDLVLMKTQMVNYPR